MCWSEYVEVNVPKWMCWRLKWMCWKVNVLKWRLWIEPGELNVRVAIPRMFCTSCSPQEGHWSHYPPLLRLPELRPLVSQTCWKSRSQRRPHPRCRIPSHFPVFECAEREREEEQRRKFSIDCAVLCSLVKECQLTLTECAEEEQRRRFNSKIC